MRDSLTCTINGNQTRRHLAGHDPQHTPSCRQSLRHAAGENLSFCQSWTYQINDHSSVCLSWSYGAGENVRFRRVWVSDGGENSRFWRQNRPQDFILQRVTPNGSILRKPNRVCTLQICLNLDRAVPGSRVDSLADRGLAEFGIRGLLVDGVEDDLLGRLLALAGDGATSHII